MYPDKTYHVVALREIRIGYQRPVYRVQGLVVLLRQEEGAPDGPVPRGIAPVERDALVGVIQRPGNFFVGIGRDIQKRP